MLSPTRQRLIEPFRIEIFARDFRNALTYTFIEIHKHQFIEGAANGDVIDQEQRPLGSHQ